MQQTWRMCFKGGLNLWGSDSAATELPLRGFVRRFVFVRDWKGYAGKELGENFKFRPAPEIQT
jgi:hypothetical protein